MLLLLACTPTEPEVPADFEVPVDCVQGIEYSNQPFTLSADGTQLAYGDAVTSDGGHTWDYVYSQRTEETPEMWPLADGTVHFASTWREHVDGLDAWWWVHPQTSVLHRTQDGVDWTAVPPAVPGIEPPPPGYLHNDLPLRAHGDHLVTWTSGAEDSVFVSNDGGQRWRNAGLPIQPWNPIAVQQAVIGPDGQVIAIVGDMTLYSEDGYRFDAIEPIGKEIGAMTVDADGTVWGFATLEVGNGGSSEVVLRRSTDWQTWETGRLLSPWDEVLHGALNGRLYALRDGGLGWFATGGVTDVSWWEEEPDFDGNAICFFHEGSQGSLTPVYSPAPDELPIGQAVPIRRFNFKGVNQTLGSPGPWGAWFPELNAVMTDGGQLWAGSWDDDGQVVDTLYNADGTLFVLSLPEVYLHSWSNYRVPMIHRLDVQTGEVLEEIEVGPFHDPWEDEWFAHEAYELHHSSDKEWPVVTVRDTVGRYLGFYQVREEMNQPPLFESWRNYVVDRTNPAGEMWFSETPFLVGTGGTSEWDHECVEGVETEGCLEQFGRLLAVHEGQLYAAGGYYGGLYTRSTTPGDTWEEVIADGGINELFVRTRDDGRHELWFLAGDDLWAAVYDGQSMRLSW